MDSIRTDIIRDRISDAWADIRSYGSNLWQIVMLSVAASAVVINLISRPDNLGVLIFFSLAGWIGIFVLSGFTFFSTMATLWISRAINERIQMVEKLSKEINITDLTFGVIVSEKKVDGRIRISAQKISEVLQWVPSKHIAIFSGLMWSASVSFWYIQIVLTIYNDLTIWLTLLFSQTVLVALMAVSLTIEYLEFSKSLKMIDNKRID